MAHPSRGNCREGRPVTARKRTLALSRSLSARARSRIAELEQEIESLQRAEEAIVVATGAPRERGCPGWVCAVTRRRFPVGASPTRQPLQPEATGAAMEVTKWLKPSDSASRIGDGASVQAVTRVNAEQASKRTMRRPTRRPFRGRLTRLGERAK